MNLPKSVRAVGAIKFIAFSIVTGIAWALIYWVTRLSTLIPVGASVTIIGLPGALAIVGLLELLSGVPGPEVASRLNQLPKWQQNIIWVLFFCLLLAGMLFAMITFG